MPIMAAGEAVIDLIDGEALCQLMFDLRLGIEVRERVVHDVRTIEQFSTGLIPVLDPSTVAGTVDPSPIPR